VVRLLRALEWSQTSVAPDVGAFSREASIVSDYSNCENDRPLEPTTPLPRHARRRGTARIYRCVLVYPNALAMRAQRYTRSLIPHEYRPGKGQHTEYVGRSSHRVDLANLMTSIKYDPLQDRENNTAMCCIPARS
jgi:hypothetical protein